MSTNTSNHAPRIDPTDTVTDMLYESLSTLQDDLDHIRTTVGGIEQIPTINAGTVAGVVLAIAQLRRLLRDSVATPLSHQLAVGLDKSQWAEDVGREVRPDGRYYSTSPPPKPRGRRVPK